MKEEDQGRPWKKLKIEEGNGSGGTSRGDTIVPESETVIVDELTSNHESSELDADIEVEDPDVPVFSDMDSGTDSGYEEIWTEQDQQQLQKFKDRLKTMDVSFLLKVLSTYDSEVQEKLRMYDYEAEGFQTPSNMFLRISFEAAVDEVERRFILKNCTCPGDEPALLLSQPSNCCSCGRSIENGDLRIRLEASSHESFMHCCADFINTLPIFKSDSLLRPVYRSLFLAVHWEVLDQVRTRSGSFTSEYPLSVEAESRADCTRMLAATSAIFCMCFCADRKTPQELVQEFLDPSIAVLVETGWPSSEVVNGMLHGASFCIPPNYRQRVVRTSALLQRRATSRFDSVEAAVNAFGDQAAVQLAWEFVFLFIAEAKFISSGNGIDCARLAGIINFICRFSSIGQNRHDECTKVSTQEAGSAPGCCTAESTNVSRSTFHRLQKLLDSAILECGETYGVSFEDENCDKEYVSDYPKLEFDTDKVEALSHVFLVINSRRSAVTVLTFAMVQHSLFGTMLSLLQWIKRYAFDTVQNQEEDAGQRTNGSSLISLLTRKLQDERHTNFLEKIGPLFQRLCSTKAGVYKTLIESGVKMWKSVIGGASNW